MTSANEPNVSISFLASGLTSRCGMARNRISSSKLVIGEGIGPGLAEAPAQSFAMPVIMRRGVFKAGGRLAVAAGFFNSPHMTSHPKHDAIASFCNAEMLGKVANRRGRPCFAGA